MTETRETERPSLDTFINEYNAFEDASQTVEKLGQPGETGFKAQQKIRQKLAKANFPEAADPKTDITAEKYMTFATEDRNAAAKSAVGYFLEHGDFIFSQIQPGRLEEMALDIDPVKLDDSMSHSAIHNGAAKRHANYLNIKGINSAYKNPESAKKKVSPQDYVKIMSEQVFNSAVGLLAGKKYLDEKDVKRWASAVASIANSESVAQNIGARLEKDAKKGFVEFFDKEEVKGNYSIAQYAMTNLQATRDPKQMMSLVYNLVKPKN